MSDKQQKQLQELKEAYQFVSATNQGRMVLNDIIRISGFHQSAFNGQTNQTIKNVGMQAVGQYVYATVREHCSDDFIKLVNEESIDG